MATLPFPSVTTGRFFFNRIVILVTLSAVLVIALGDFCVQESRHAQ